MLPVFTTFSKGIQGVNVTYKKGGSRNELVLFLILLIMSSDAYTEDAFSFRNNQ